MNVLITNSVPLNGGDEALLRAAVESITLRWPGARVTTLCRDVARSRALLPDLDLGADIEAAGTAEERLGTRRAYEAADVVAAAPGGYLHDHYDIEARLQGFEVAVSLGKPTVLLAQSIGPFWKEGSKSRAAAVLNRVDRICVRDRASARHLLTIGVHPDRVVETADMAFLWRRLAPDVFRPKTGPVRAIALCFRAWPIGAPIDDTVTKAVHLARHLLRDPGRTLVFISTCQGVPGYVDDSAVALQIAAGLTPEERSRVQVDRCRRPPRQLIATLAEFDAYIGMRLHGAILSMLGGTPALGLGYETKTAEIFRQLGLGQLHVDFGQPVADWIDAADSLVERASGLGEHLRAALGEAAVRAEGSLDAIEAAVALRSTGGSMRTSSQGEWPTLVHQYDVPHLRLRQVAALVNQLRPASMVDVGCATGQLRKLCPGIAYTGCDFVRPSAEVDFPFYQCDFNHEPLPATLTDLELVVCSGILEYIEDVGGFLDQIRSRLRPGGHLVATYFNMNHVSRLWGLVRGASFPVRADWRGFHSPAAMAEQLRSAGFDIVRTVPTRHSLRSADGVRETVSGTTRLPAMRPWSRLAAHQLIFVAAARTATGTPVAEICRLVPEDATIILVDDAQWDPALLAGRRVRPFLEHDGQYWGSPADDATAIAELERMRGGGASFIAFPPPGRWWLEYYRGFAAHLRSTARCVSRTDELVVFDLRSGR